MAVQRGPPCPRGVHGSIRWKAKASAPWQQSALRGYQLTNGRSAAPQHMILHNAAAQGVAQVKQTGRRLGKREMCEINVVVLATHDLREPWVLRQQFPRDDARLSPRGPRVQELLATFLWPPAQGFVFLPFDAAQILGDDRVTSRRIKALRSVAPWFANLAKNRMMPS